VLPQQIDHTAQNGILIKDTDQEKMRAVGNIAHFKILVKHLCEGTEYNDEKYRMLVL
jgi:hypothetical protein